MLADTGMLATMRTFLRFECIANQLLAMQLPDVLAWSMQVLSVVGTLTDETDPMVSVMKVQIPSSTSPLSPSHEKSSLVLNVLSLSQMRRQAERGPWTRMPPSRNL